MIGEGIGLAANFIPMSAVGNCLVKGVGLAAKTATLANRARVLGNSMKLAQTAEKIQKGGNIWAKSIATGTEKITGDWAKLSGILRQAAKGNCNFTGGSVTMEQAFTLGKAWVGEGYTVSRNGIAWISKNGLRKFRPPKFKPNLGKVQANLQRKFEGQTQKDWPSNSHLNIIE